MLSQTFYFDNIFNKINNDRFYLRYSNRYLLTGGREDNSNLVFDYTLPTGNLKTNTNYNKDELNKTYSLQQSYVQNQQFGTDSFSYSVDKSNLSNIENNQFNINLSQQKSAENFSYSVKNYQNSNQKYENASFGFSNSYFPSINMQTNLGYYLNTDATQQEGNLHPELIINTKVSDAVLNMVYNADIDLDGNNVTTDARNYFLQKQPEVEIIPAALNMSGFSLSSRVVLGRYNENKYIGGGSEYIRNLTGEDRVYLSQALNNSFSLPLSANFTMTDTYEQYLYHLGDAQYVFSQRYALNNEFGFLKNSLSYESMESEGNTPFYFDEINSPKRIFIRNNTNLLFFSWLTLSIANGWNLILNTRDDESYELRVGDSKPFSFVSRTSYSHRYERWNNLVNDYMVRLDNDRQFSASSVHSLQNGLLLSAAGQFRWAHGSTWRDKFKLSVSLLYDTYYKQLVYPRIEIVKDMECWEAIYTWNKSIEEHRITFRIMAFPSQPIGVNSSRYGTSILGLDNLMPDELKDVMKFNEFIK